MRISVRPYDSDYDPGAKKYTAYLDGVKVDRCFMADEERGELWVWDADADGKLIIDGDALKEKMLTGKVELRLE